MIDIVRYVAEFDLPLDELKPEQVAMFVAARNVASSVDEMEVRVATEPQAEGDLTLVERVTDQMLDQTAYYDACVDWRLPTDEMDVSMVHSVEDLPRIFPTQWLLEETRPELFYAKLAERELLVPQWQRPTDAPRDADAEVQDRELVEEQAIADTPKQHAYVLLDTSRTMNDHDRRGTVARGLALAFLLKGYQQRAQLNLRPFTAYVGELSSGKNKDDFRVLTRRVIGLPNAGQTRIQNALEQAVLDIRRAGPCQRAEIMLITDGLSRIAKNPLRQEQLHTFLLGDLFEDQRTAGTIDTLKAWSTTFHRIWINRFAEILAPTLRDLEAAGQLLQALVEEANEPGSESAAGSLRRVYDNVAFLVREFKRTLGKRAPLPAEVQALEAMLQDAKQLLAQRPEPPASPGESQAAMAGRVPASEMWMTRGSAQPGAEPFDLWKYLCACLARTWQWTRRSLRRLVRLEP